VTAPQVKICGLTTADEAVACATLGAHAVGCVFYPPSPRHVTLEQAREIVRELPTGVCTVGVFVNATRAEIMTAIDRCGLKAVQLHGRESVALVENLIRAGVTVIKALFVNGSPGLDQLGAYPVSGYLIECAGGRLPGGNAKTWDWGSAGTVSRTDPIILAGGLKPSNVARAIAAALPDAVDVSSGVESEPGKKDLEKVKRFLASVRHSRGPRALKRIF
jgi:phosphoribosylanthranilate isomerase